MQVYRTFNEEMNHENRNIENMFVDVDDFLL